MKKGWTEPITNWGAAYPRDYNFVADPSYTLLADRNGSNNAVVYSTDVLGGAISRYVVIEVINTLPTANSGSASIRSIEIPGWKWE